MTTPANFIAPPPTGSNPTAWNLYRRSFKEGEMVVVFTINSELVVGNLRSTDEGMYLRKHDGPERFLEWYDIVFMCHGGFPVRKLMGADGSDSVEQLVSKDEDLRLMIGAGKKIKSLLYADPILIEGVTAELHNKGNIGEAFDNGPLWPWVECVTMAAKDGARGMLWDLNCTFHLEGMNGP